ncbi:MAG: lysine-sensitive aspartokinase 3 [Bdellovibrionales bacterium]
MIVMKFGGTSVQDAPAIRRLMDIVETRPGRRLVVVSALAGVTNQLLEIAELAGQQRLEAALEKIDLLKSRHDEVARQLGLPESESQPLHKWWSQLHHIVEALVHLGEVSPRSRDLIYAFGELASSHLVARAFNGNAKAARWLDSRELVVTDATFGQAAVDFVVTTERLRTAMKMESAQVLIAQGFIGVTPEGQTTTLGRGGSDYSAAVYGACLEAERIEIWTDVSGILTCDPRIVASARPIPQIGFDEAAEMAFFGAKVLHPATIYPAIQRRIPIWILNSKAANDHGTEITFDGKSSDGVRGLAFKRNVTLVNLNSTRMLGAHGFLKSVFDIFAKHRLSVDLISTSEVSLSLTLDPSHDSQQLIAALSELKAVARVEVAEKLATISVVGGGIRTTPGLAARIFSEVRDFNVRMISMGASELNLSFVVSDSDLPPVLAKLHDQLVDKN